MKVNILKNLGIVFLASFIGIMTNPEMLTASDTVAVYGIDASNVVETVVEVADVAPETTVGAPAAGVVENKGVVTIAAKTAKVTEPVKAVETAKVVETTKVAESAKDVGVDKAMESVPVNNVQFSWGAQGIFETNSTAINAGNQVARMGKLIWGHNYTTFGNIVRLKIGDTFTISENGKTTTYQVVANPINGAAGVVLDKKSETALSYADNAKYDNITMNAMVNYGMGHSLVLMTCYGSNSRYVVVADAI